MCCSRQKKQLLLPIQIHMQAWVRMGETNLPAALKWDLQLESQLPSPSQTGFSCTKLHRSLPGVGITLQWNQCTQGIHAGSSHPSDSEATVCDLSIHQSCIGARDIPASTTQCPVPVMPLPKAFQHPGTTLNPRRDSRAAPAWYYGLEKGMEGLTQKNPPVFHCTNWPKSRRGCGEQPPTWQQQLWLRAGRLKGRKRSRVAQKGAAAKGKASLQRGAAS